MGEIVLLGIIAIIGALTLIFQVYSWWPQHSAEHKIVFDGVLAPKVLADNGTVKGLQLGINFKNLAEFPIEYRVTKMETQFMGLYPPKKPYRTKGGIIPPLGIRHFTDNSIELPPPQRNKIVEAHIDYRLEYGKPKHLDHFIEGKIGKSFRYDEEGNLSEDGKWWSRL